MESKPVTSRDQVFFLDALKYSFIAAEKSFGELRVCLEEKESFDLDGASEDRAVAMVSCAWGLVDAGHRVRELIQQIPMLKKNAAEIQVFLRATENIENLRHYVQHLRTGISRLPEKSTPIWGVVSWVSEKNDEDCYTVLLGTAREDVNVFSCTYDTVNREFVQRIMLSVNEVNVDLAEVRERLAAVSNYLAEWATQFGYSMEMRKLPVFKFSVPGHLA